MIKRTIEISSEPVHLTVKNQQLLILAKDDARTQRASIPCEDIGLVLVEHPGTTYSHAALMSLCIGEMFEIDGEGGPPPLCVVQKMRQDDKRLNYKLHTDARKSTDIIRDNLCRPDASAGRRAAPLGQCLGRANQCLRPAQTGHRDQKPQAPGQSARSHNPRDSQGASTRAGAGPRPVGRLPARRIQGRKHAAHANKWCPHQESPHARRKRDDPVRQRAPFIPVREA